MPPPGGGRRRRSHRRSRDRIQLGSCSFPAHRSPGASTSAATTTLRGHRVSAGYRWSTCTPAGRPATASPPDFPPTTRPSPRPRSANCRPDTRPPSPSSDMREAMGGPESANAPSPRSRRRRRCRASASFGAMNPPKSDHSALWRLRRGCRATPPSSPRTTSSPPRSLPPPMPRTEPYRAN